MIIQRVDRRIGRDLALDAVAAACAVVAAVLASGRPGVSALLLLAGAVTVAVRLWMSVQTDGDRPSPLGLASTARVLLTAATAVAVVDRSSGVADVIAAGLGLLVVAAVLSAEPLLRRAARIRVPLVSGLPGITGRDTGRDLGWPAALATVLPVVVGAVVAWINASAAWWLLASVLALAFPSAIAVRGRAALLGTRALRAELPAALKAYAPRFLVYTSRPDDAAHQVTMWLPYLQRTGLPFVIVTRNRVPAEALAELSDVPVIEARQVSDLEAALVPSLRAAFYVNASSGNGALVRFHQLAHVYLGHGDSDKPPSYNPTHAMYDQVFAAGPAAIRRYADHGVRIPRDKFAIVGRPQVENVSPAGAPIAEASDPVVLYAPTWRGHVEETLLYSLPQGEAIVSAVLARGATVIFRPHPFSYAEPEDAAFIARIQQLLVDDTTRTGRAHVFGPSAERDLGIIDCINASDAMVSDVSSVVSDYLFSSKPFAMVAVPSAPEDFVVEYPVARAAYVIRGDLTNLDPVLEDLLGPDPQSARRDAVRADNLGDFPRVGYAMVFVDAVRRLATSLPLGTGVRNDDTEAGPSGETVEDPPAGSGAEARPSDGADSEDPVAAVARRGVLTRYWPVVRRSALTLVAAGLAVLAVLSALFGADWWCLSLGVASLLCGVLPLVDNVRLAERRYRLVDQFSVPRGLLILAWLVLASGRTTATGSGLSGILALAVTGTALAVALTAEATVGRSWERLGLEVRDFEGLDRPVRELVPRGFLPLAGATLILLLMVLAVVDLPMIISVVLALVSLALVVDTTIRSLRRARQVVVDEDRFPAVLAAYAPQFAVYFASPVGAPYQIGMWLPYFLRIGRPFVIVTRTLPMMRAVAELNAARGVPVPVIFRPTLRSVEEVVVPSLTTVFYVNNAARNTHLVERRELTHVWLNHGDSEKPACFNPVHAIYDLLFAAGQAGIDRYARHGVEIPREKFRIVGRPQVEIIEPARQRVAEAPEPTVLYAPTWEGPFADSRVYSLPVGQQIVAALLARGTRVVFRAHPFNYRYLASRNMIASIGRLLETDRRRTGRQHLWGVAAEQQLSVEECFNLSDAMICDVSAVISDYLKSSKPFSVVAVGRSADELVADAPSAAVSYILNGDLRNIDAVLDQLLGPDPLAPERAAARRYYLGDFEDDTYAEGFLRAAREVIDSRRSR